MVLEPPGKQKYATVDHLVAAGKVATAGEQIASYEQVHGPIYGLPGRRGAGATGRRRWPAAAGKKITQEDVEIINLFDSLVRSLR